MSGQSASTGAPSEGAERAETADGTGLRRSLGFRDLVVYGLLFIAPMAPVGVFGTLDAKSHGAVALVYLIATVAMAFTAFSYAQMVRVVPQAGSVFAYARAGLGKGPGFIAGWMAMLDYLLIPAVAYLFSGIAMNALVPSVSRWVWTAIAVLITTALNLWGVRAAARVGFAVLAMEVVVLIVFIVAAVVVLVQDGARREWLSPLTGDGSQGAFALSAVVGAVSIAVLSYLGFDAIASFAEEVTGGSAKVARAVLFCLALAGVLFVAQTYLVALLEPLSSAELAAEPGKQGTAFYDSVDSAAGAWLHDLVAVSKAIGAAFAALAGQAAAGRLLFAMARDRRLPKVLSRTDSGTPRVALLCAAVVTLVAAVWAARRDDGMDHLVSVVDIGALTAFLLLHASVVG
ncbi:amino acid permease, partial [Streptomyces sp. BG9H]